jgi:hypothetical protein
MRRAQRYSAKSLQAMAREGGIATRNRCGNEFFREIRKKRKPYLKGYVTKKTEERILYGRQPRIALGNLDGFDSVFSRESAHHQCRMNRHRVELTDLRISDQKLKRSGIRSSIELRRTR